VVAEYALTPTIKNAKVIMTSLYISPENCVKRVVKRTVKPMQWIGLTKVWWRHVV